jgi:succinoglycan biosynthesis protein ExoM
MERLDICICTFRRPSLVATIESIAAQDVRGTVALRIVVADNDETPSAQPLVTQAERFGVPIHYVHAPARNISIARNACLDAAETRWIAFIDDDEIAAPNWLARLLAARASAEVVFGRSHAVIGEDAPRWLRDGHFHHNSISARDGSHNGYTCNVLLDREFLQRHAIRFLEPLGQTGGEDTLFFHDVGKAGGRARYERRALVYEDIPPRRATLGWLTRRRFRAGQVHFLLRRRDGAGSFREVPLALAKLAYCYAAAVATLPRPRRAAAAFLRGTLHLGFISSAFGARIYAEYGKKAGR